MPDAIEVSDIILAPPQQVYDAWLSGEQHAAMTGGDATCDARVGGHFTAWDGYIEGECLELTPPTRIVQSWRTSEFPDGAPDSRLEVSLAPTDDGRGTRITLTHTNIPDGQGRMYEEGWREHYFTPMKGYFAP